MSERYLSYGCNPEQQDFFRSERIKLEIAYSKELSPEKILNYLTNEIYTAIPFTSRNYNLYKGFLGFDDSDLGDLVLDLGSGVRDNFARSTQNSNRNVISVNPLLLFCADRYWRTAKEFEFYEDGQDLSSEYYSTIAAWGHELPFKDNTFDSIVSLYAVPYYVEPDIDKYISSIKESVRVLKPGRSFYFGPVKDADNLKDTINYINNSDTKLQLSFTNALSAKITKI